MTSIFVGTVKHITVRHKFTRITAYNETGLPEYFMVFDENFIKKINETIIGSKIKIEYISKVKDGKNFKNVTNLTIIKDNKKYVKFIKNASLDNLEIQVNDFIDEHNVTQGNLQQANDKSWVMTLWHTE